MPSVIATDGVCSSPRPCGVTGASPKKESGTSAGKAALGHVLVVPVQLLPMSGPPQGITALPVIIPMAKKTYAEEAATQALERATHVYVKRWGVGPLLADKYERLYLVLEKGPRSSSCSWGRERRWSAETGLSST